MKKNDSKVYPDILLKEKKNMSKPYTIKKKELFVFHLNN